MKMFPELSGVEALQIFKNKIQELFEDEAVTLAEKQSIASAYIDDAFQRGYALGEQHCMERLKNETKN